MTRKQRMKAVGLNIWMARKDSEMSQVELAKLLSCGQSALSQIENGRRGLSLEMLYAIASAFGCEPGSLLSGVQ